MKKQHVTASIWTDETGQKAIRDGEGGTRIIMVASTASMDRDNEMIDVDGWHWNEAALPKLLWGHDYHNADSVVGRLVRVWKEGGALMIEAELADRVAEAETARLVAGLMRSGFLDQGSVGFIPEEWVDPDGKRYTRENPGNYYGSVPGRRYVKQELLEFSIVPVPSQRDSVLVGVRGLFPEHEATPEGAPTASPDSTKAAPPPPAPEQTWFEKLFGPSETKAGAVLSRANKERLSNAKASLSAVAESLDEVLRSAERADSTE